MSNLLPEKVDTSNVIALRNLADDVVVWAAESDDAAALWEQRRRATTLERYVQDRKTKDRLLRAAGWTMAHLGRVLGDGPGHGPGRGHENPPTVGGFSIPSQRVSEARTLRTWALDRAEPEIVAALDEGQLSAVFRLIAELTPVESTSGEIVDDDERYRLIGGDFRDVAADMPDRSIDLIITDPPYPTEYLPLYEDLGRVAARLLRPRGLLLVVTGQLHLPTILGMLGQSMNYGWTIVLDLLPGGGSLSRIMGRHIIQTWKPILAYSVGKWPSGEWHKDRVISPAADQARFAWGQAVAPAVELIESYSRPNAVVLDPFLGGGAYGEAALRAGRRFIGIELHPEKLARAADRISGAVD